MSTKCFYKCNAHGKGYKREGNQVTAFDDRILFLNKNTNYDRNENIPDSSSRIKRKVAVNSEAEDKKVTNGADNNVKRMKNGHHFAEESKGEKGKMLGEPGKASPLANDLLLRTILGKLIVPDLKSCRQVNRLWYLEVTKIFHKLDSLAAIEISKNTAALPDAAVYKRPVPLQNFRSVLTNSTVFPSTSFALNNNPLSQNVVDFFRDHGRLVKSFRFEPQDMGSSPKYTPKLEDIVLLAALHMPNLKRLELAGIEEETTSVVVAMAIDNAPEMKNLRDLEIDCYVPSRLTALILKKAPNLENIFSSVGANYRFELVWKKLIPLQTIPLLRNIHLYFAPAWLDLYQKILDQKPQFSTIGTIGLHTGRLDWNSSKVGPFITQTFHQCSESLTEIMDIRSLKNISGLRFPVLRNVKRIGMDPAFLLYSDVNFNSAQIFPNLTTVQVEVSEENVPEEIPSISLCPLLSVRHLQVKWDKRYIPDVWVAKICSSFPNVTSAKFCNLLKHSAYEFVWKLRALQDLHLAIGTKPGMNLLPEMDSAFTGFSVESVKGMLKKDLEGVSLSDEEVRALRVKPSIAELKELRRLSLRLFDVTAQVSLPRNSEDQNKNKYEGKNVEVIFDPGNGNALLHLGGKIILSYISKRFGFDLCPQLNSNVSVAFTHLTSLGDVGNDIEADEGNEIEILDESEEEMNLSASEDEEEVESEDDDEADEDEDADGGKGDDAEDMRVGGHPLVILDEDSSDDD